MNDAPPGLTTVTLPPSMLVAAAAEEIARGFADRLPDLSCLTVLLPNLHAAAGVKQALCRATGEEVLLLPRFITLAALAQSAPLERPVAPQSLRLVQLYGALKARDWFDAADLWGISAELAQLLDELTRAQTELPHDREDFLRLIEQAYQAKNDAAMQFEARLAHEMWYALNRSEATDADSSLDAAAAYQAQLAALAGAASAPLYAIGLPELAPAESAFLRQYAERQPVRLLSADAAISADPLTACLAAAWAAVWTDAAENEPPPASIRERAQVFAAGHPVSPLVGRLALYAATSLEDEAQAAVQEIKARIAEGKRAIALVAADRLTARRVRARLERDAILLADESGWTLSTTSASTILMRLLDTFSDGFYHRDVLDLAKSPFFAADWPPSRRKRAVHRLEAWVRQRNVSGGLGRLQALAAREAPGGDEEAIIRRLERARIRLKSGRRTLAQWTDRLLLCLEDLGATPGLAADAAGRQLLDLLALRAQELADHREPLSLAEWRRWLNAELEAATFRDAAIDSPVVLVSLAGTRLRQFEAVVLVGADATHLAARPVPARLFNQSVRRQLGLRGAAETAAQMQRDLIGLIAASGSVLLTWQASREGEHNAASPWLARLQVFHAMAYGAGRLQAASPPSVTAQMEMQFPRAAPHPSVPSVLLPATISASGYGSLMACPYQFFARHVLRLNERDEVAEEMEKRDYGELVHDILARFHRRHPLVLALPDAEAETALQGITEEVFADRMASGYASLAWKLRWEKRLPAYLAWQRQRERDGWRFHAAEEQLQRPFALEEGATVNLKGRLDRIDRSENDGRFAVLDYKTQKKALLTNKLKQPGEDVQLAVYSLLLAHEVSEAAYVCLDEGNSVATVAANETLPLLIETVGERLGELMNGLASGEPLPAQGTSGVCRFCEMRGLCRVDYWDE